MPSLATVSRRLPRLMFDSARRSIVARSFLQVLKMKSLRAGFALLFVCLSLPVFAGPADEALQRFADGTTTLSAHFEQIQVDEHNEVISRRRKSEERRAGKECVSTCKYRW